MLELDIKDGKLTVQDNGELTYVNSSGLIADFNTLIDKDSNTSQHQNNN